MIDQSISATTEDGSLLFTLTVTNAGREPTTLTFRTGQRAEFTAHEADGDGNGSGGDGDDSGGDGDDSGGDGDDVDTHDSPIWRYGEGRLFTQAIETETLGPDEAVTCSATWSDPPEGSYRVVGELLAEETTGTAETTVTVP